MNDVRSRLLKASVLLLCSRGPRDVEEAGWIYAGLLREELDTVERAHCEALGAALDAS